MKFWYSNSYFDIRTESENSILTFDILFWYSNWVGKCYFDIQNPILTFELSRKFVFWHSKFYFDIRTESENAILIFKILFWHSKWVGKSYFERTSMLKARVFPNYKNVIRIIWFCIVLTANTCSLHENQHYHVWSSMVYVKQAMTSTLLLALVAIVFTHNNVQTISIFIVILH